MKYITIFLLFFCLECSEILTPEQIETERIVLLEIFGYSLCSNCHFADHAADSLYREFSGELYVLEYHYPQLGDTLSPQSETNNRAQWYNVTAFPTAFINGRIRREGAGEKVIDEYRNYIQLERGREPPVNLELENSIFNSSGILKIFIDYTNEDLIDFGDTRLFCILTEDSVFFKQSGAMDSIYNHTVRLFIPDGKGISISENDTILELPYTLKSFWDRERIELIVFLQNLTTKEVYQAAGLKLDSLIPTPYSFYVETSDTIQNINPGEEAVFTFQLYNTGIEDDEYMLELIGVGFPDSWLVQFCYGNLCLISGLPYRVLETIAVGEADTGIAVHVFTDTLQTTGIMEFTFSSQSDTTLVEKYNLSVVTSSRKEERKKMPMELYPSLQELEGWREKYLMLKEER